MKSTLIYFVFFLGAAASINAQQSNKGGMNSPGETSKNTTENNSSVRYVNEFEYLQDKVTKNATKLESLYFVEKEVFIGYGDGVQTVKQPVKKNIYKAGQILIEDYQNDLDQLNGEDEVDQIRLLREIEKVQDQLFAYSKQSKTRTIEKQLKKLKTSEEIIPIFFNAQ